jgi:hypothetical protein
MAPPSSSEQVPNPLWVPCPQGEFQKLSRRLRARRHRRDFLRASTAVTAVLAAGAGAWLLFGPAEDEPVDYYYGEIACSEVRSHALAFVRGTLPEDLKQRITAHLSYCIACRNYIEALRS